MALITILMIVVCLSIYITMRFSLVSQINEEMLLIEQNYQNYYSLSSLQDKLFRNDDNFSSMPATNYSLFVVDVNNRYQINYYTSINCDDVDLMRGVTDVCVNTNADKGYIRYDNQFYYFSKIHFGKTSTRIIVLDVTSKMILLNKLFINIIIIGAVALILIFIISSFFTNKSMKPVEIAFIKQKNFISDASHELKTPIAVIKTNLDVLRKITEFDNEDEKWLNYAVDEVNQMSKMVNEFLYLARMEDTVPSEIATIVDLSSVVNSVLLSMEAIAFEKHIAIYDSIQDDIFVKGYVDELKRLIKILVDNSIKYCNESGDVFVVLSAHGNTGNFLIKNTGTVIENKDKNMIFERFYRANKERERSSQSYGIGLSIAKSTCERHGFSIKAYPENNMTCFRVSFKLVNKV